MCLSLNLSSTYRRATEVLPTHPSPSKTTLKLYPLVILTTGLDILEEKERGGGGKNYLFLANKNCLLLTQY